MGIPIYRERSPLKKLWCIVKPFIKIIGILPLIVRFVKRKIKIMRKINRF